MHLIIGTLTGFLIFFAVCFSIMSSEPSTEQAFKALQAQNTQFQELFMNLAKGQQDLKALILKERKKKAKKPVYVVSVGRRRPANRALDFATPSKGWDNQEEETREEDSSSKESDDESDYD